MVVVVVLIIIIVIVVVVVVVVFWVCVCVCVCWVGGYTWLDLLGLTERGWIEIDWTEIDRQDEISKEVNPTTLLHEAFLLTCVVISPMANVHVEIDANTLTGLHKLTTFPHL